MIEQDVTRTYVLLLNIDNILILTQLLTPHAM